MIFILIEIMESLELKMGINFLVFPPKILTHLVEFASWKMYVIALMVTLILSQLDKFFKPSSHESFEGYFTVSPKIMEIFS
jgi:hypothetical protein